MGSTVPSPPPHESPADAGQVRSRHAARDFAQLARRISSRTADLFAVALIAVALLTVGVQATRWWRAEPSSITSGPVAAAALGIWDQSAHASIQLDAGDWSLERLTTTGTDSAVTARAVETARRELLSGEPADPGPPDAGEERWLAALAQSSPVEEPANGGKIFVLGGPWPWVVATRSIRATIAEPPPQSRAAEGARVVCWLFALPQVDQTWTLYIARRGRNPGDTAHGFEVPIPQDAQRLLSARTDTAGATVFSSSDSLIHGRNRWERQLTDAGWMQRGPWSQAGSFVRGAFEREQAGRTVCLDTLLTTDSYDRLRGIAEWHTKPAKSP